MHQNVGWKSWWSSDCGSLEMVREKNKFVFTSTIIDRVFIYLFFFPFVQSIFTVLVFSWLSIDGLDRKNCFFWQKETLVCKENEKTNLCLSNIVILSRIFFFLYLSIISCHSSILLFYSNFILFRFLCRSFCSLLLWHVNFFQKNIDKI